MVLHPPHIFGQLRERRVGPLAYRRNGEWSSYHANRDLGMRARCNRDSSTAHCSRHSVTEAHQWQIPILRTQLVKMLGNAVAEMGAYLLLVATYAGFVLQMSQA